VDAHRSSQPFVCANAALEIIIKAAASISAFFIINFLLTVVNFIQPTSLIKEDCVVLSSSKALFSTHHLPSVRVPWLDENITQPQTRRLPSSYL
jgi:hypothetical protein